MQQHVEQLFINRSRVRSDKQLQDELDYLDSNEAVLNIKSELHSSSSTLISLRDALQKCIENNFYLNNLNENSFKYYLIVHLSGFNNQESNRLLRIVDHSGTINAIFTHSAAINTNIMIDGILLIESFNLISYQNDNKIHYAVEINTDYVYLIDASKQISQFVDDTMKQFEFNCAQNAADADDCSIPSEICGIKGTCCSRSTILSRSTKQSIRYPVFLAEFVDVSIYFQLQPDRNYKISRIKIIFENEQCMFWNAFLMVNKSYLMSNLLILNPKHYNQTELLLKFQCDPTINIHPKSYYNFIDYYPLLTPQNSMSWIIEIAANNSNANMTQQTIQQYFTQKKVADQHRLSPTLQPINLMQQLNIAANKRNDMLLFSQSTIGDKIIYPAPIPTSNHKQTADNASDPKSLNIYLPTGYSAEWDESQFGSIMCSAISGDNSDDAQQSNSCINYEGIIHKVYANLVWILDDKIKFYLCKFPFPNSLLPIGLRCGSTIRIYHAHLMWRGDKCVGIGCCAYTVIELLGLSNISTHKTINTKKNALRQMNGNRALFNDTNSVLSLYYKTQCISECIDILHFTRSFKKKFGKQISTDYILGTKRYFVSKSNGSNNSNNSKDKPIIEYFGDINHKKKVNQQFFLNHQQCTFYNCSNIPIYFPTLISLENAILNDERIRECIQYISDQKHCCFKVFPSIDITNTLIGTISCSDSGYFQLCDTSLMIPGYLITSGNQCEYDKYSNFIKALSQNKKCLLRIKQYKLCLIRQRRQSLALLSPSHGKAYKLGNAICVLFFNFADCEIIQIMNINNNQSVGKKRSFAVMNQQMNDTNICGENVSLLLQNKNNNNNKLYYTVQMKQNKLYFSESALRWYCLFNSCIQCNVVMDAKIMNSSNSNGNKIEIRNANNIKQITPTNYKKIMLADIDSFCGLIVDKKWIFEDEINLIDRLFVIKYDIKAQIEIVVMVDIPHNHLSTFLICGMTVKFYAFQLTIKNNNKLICYLPATASNWQISNVSTVNDEINAKSLDMTPFACLYELPFDNKIFYGKVIKFCNCKIVNILSMKICLKCFNCNKVFGRKTPKICPNCIAKQIIGICTELEMVIDDGSSQCLLIKEYNDIQSILNLSKMQHIRFIHRLKDSGYLKLKFANNVNIIDAINSNAMWQQLAKCGIKENGICKGFAYILSRNYDIINSAQQSKAKLHIKCKQDKELKKWINELDIIDESICFGSAYRKQSVSLLRQSKLTLKCIEIASSENDFESHIDLLLNQMSE